MKLCLDNNVKVRKEAVWALRNATFSSSKEQITYFINIGVIKTVNRVLEDNEDLVILEITLDALQNILHIFCLDLDFLKSILKDVNFGK
jgi:hypothetical protein